MTKCHLFLLAALALLSVSCKSGGQGTSLSDYGSRSAATRTAQFEQYVLELREMPLPDAMRRQDSLLRTAEQDSAEWARLTELEAKYLIDPNSPFRNEELYIPVVRHLLSAPYSTESQRTYAEYILPRLLLNRPGERAADFGFITPKGRRSSLYEVLEARHPQQTILFFSNPGCPNCKEITESLEAQAEVQTRIAAGELLVVNIYPDEDVEAWLDYLPNYPDSWVCGQDADQLLNSNTVYWLRAIPSLYLLDAEGRGVLKDARPEDILKNSVQR